MKQATCQERIGESLLSRVSTLRDLWDCEEEYHPEHQTNMYEYGLSFDYVIAGTFENQNESYFRYQLSWGGPGDEFRIFADQTGQYQWSVYRIEYWFLDWGDGASITLQGDDLELLADIFEQFFVDSGTVDHIYLEAIEC